jgi:hypothetical protein
MAVKRDAADMWFSKCVRARDRHCLYCGNQQSNECAHIVGRRNKAVRWDMMNAVCLCHHHHRHFTENPLAFNDWLRMILGEAHLDILREKSQHIFKTTVAVRKEIAKHYREEYRKIEQDPDYQVISYI